MTTIDTSTCHPGHGLESYDPVGDKMLSEILDALSAGMESDTYLAARAAGMNHAEVIEVSKWDWPDYAPLLISTRAMQADASIDDLRWINETRCWNPMGTKEPRGTTSARNAPGYRAVIYADARECGLSHDEFRVFDSTLPDLSNLEHAIERIAKSDVNRTQITMFVEAGGRGLEWYIKAVDLGATHDELVETVSADGNTMLYMFAIAAGIAHNEILAVMTVRPTRIRRYIELREAGNNHEIALSRVTDVPYAHGSLRSS